MDVIGIVVCLLVLGLIVFVHEVGHFALAKFFKVGVDEFGLGFPPRLFAKRKGATEYSINAIPLGGFVKIKGEDGADRNDPDSFATKPIWQRMVIIVAGVGMNLMLAVVLFTIIFASNAPRNITGVPTENLQKVSRTFVKVEEVIDPNGPAAAVGLKAGDEIISLGNQVISRVEDLQDYSKNHPTGGVTLKIKRGGESLEKTVTPRANHPAGALGVRISTMAVTDYNLLDAVKGGVLYTKDLTIFTVTAFYELVRGLIWHQGTSVEVSGPVAIMGMIHNAAQMGIIVLLEFIAIISINLAVINILPFPALDGGRLLFLIIEKVKGSPVNAEFEGKVHTFGFLLLMLLMILVIGGDLARLGIFR